MSSELNKETFEKLINELTKNMPDPLDYNIFHQSYKPMEIKIPEPDLENVQFRFASIMWGMPVYQSSYAYETVTKVRGIPSKHKPNSRRPYYRKVIVKKPVAYSIKGHGIITPPGYFGSFV